MIHRECIVFYVIYRKDLLKIYLEQYLMFNNMVLNIARQESSIVIDKDQPIINEYHFIDGISLLII